MGMPVLMVIAECATSGPASRCMPSWPPVGRGTAVLFAVGAVSGTVLSFELGLLWPRFMEFAGGIIGLPFALEGFAFFMEAIFLGSTSTAGRRFPRRCTSPRVPCGPGGNPFGRVRGGRQRLDEQPAGFTLMAGRPADVSPLAAMANRPGKPRRSTCAGRLRRIGFAVAESTRSACCGNRERLPPGCAGIALSSRVAGCFSRKR